ncbi:MAG: UDP-glucose/GDP-mannose dehydrogenase family protein [Gloeomargarita sp. SKYBB_i_bin120]|nr:UDP-glucose/GDP-mannose dehydrogenase family protein [Gloeomargarita sp. SKYB120]MDW8177915.1 UDP-glucose/GDP-mannose dehydrogenase family protein [Gloeomargarita sp. SKYBB_i_bin120]
MGKLVQEQQVQVAIIGTGYVGLTTGVALAYLGHQVVGLDVDAQKVERLQRGDIPIYEPYLAELLHLARPNITFTTDYATAIAPAQVIFIAVGTPSLPDGNPDLTYVRQAAQGIGLHLAQPFTVIVNKSTVPIGSGNWVETLIEEALRTRPQPVPRFAVASNPEFLREGSALHDTFYPDRVVLGTQDPKALEVLHQLYQPILEQSFTPPSFLPRPDGLAAVPLVTADLASAELIKYAANAFLALKISFINEIAQLAERVGADVTQIARGIGLDKRIGSQFLQAGIGWGGSCFGKDTAALIATARDYGLGMAIVQASRLVNAQQRQWVVEKLLQTLKILKGRRVGLLGLAFKPHTDDLRDAPAYDIAQQLLERGVAVRVHDPVALERARREWSKLDVQYCDDVTALAQDADALVLVTDWPQYRDLPWETLAATMRQPLLIDGRNFLDRERLQRAGFTYLGMGR